MPNWGKPLYLARIASILFIIAVLFLPTLSLNKGYSVIVAQGQSSNEVIVVELNVPIDSGSSGLVSRAISQANSDMASAVIIDMNTPGGLVSDMLSMVNDITSSSVPVYTYVGNGSLAASAGSYIAMATKKIFMGPGSQIGPSTPIVVGGSDLEQNHTASAMLSLMKSLATENGRNATAVSVMVEYDIAYSYDQALKYHVADYESNSLSDTLAMLNLTKATMVTFSESPTEQLLSFLSNPTVDGILFLIGIIAITLDLLHPTILLSIAGAVLMALALIGAEAIQGGSSTYAYAVPLILFALAAALIVLEIKTGHGFMLFAGVVVGAFATLLLAYEVPYSPSPYGEISYAEIILLLAVGAVLALYARWVGRSIRTKPQTGAEALVGKKGFVTSELSPVGEVSIEGIIWRARIAPSFGASILKKGDHVKVFEVNGLELVVVPELIRNEE